MTLIVGHNKMLNDSTYLATLLSRHQLYIKFQFHLSLEAMAVTLAGQGG